METDSPPSEMKYTHKEKHRKPSTMKFVTLTYTIAKQIQQSSQQLADGMTDAALAQEPWIYRSQIRGLTNVVK